MRKPKYEYIKAWRKRHPDKWNEEKKKYYSQFSNAPNDHERYSDDEFKMILEHNIPDRELSKQIGRSVRAIQIMRSRLKDGLYGEVE